MTPEELKRLREVCDKAPEQYYLSADRETINECSRFYHEARTALPALLDEVERLTEWADNHDCKFSEAIDSAKLLLENTRLREALEKANALSDYWMNQTTLEAEKKVHFETSLKELKKAARHLLNQELTGVECYAIEWVEQALGDGK